MDNSILVHEYNDAGEIIETRVVGLMTYDEFDFNYERSQLPVAQVDFEGFVSGVKNFLKLTGGAS